MGKMQHVGVAVGMRDTQGCVFISLQDEPTLTLVLLKCGMMGS